MRAGFSSTEILCRLGFTSGLVGLAACAVSFDPEWSDPVPALDAGTSLDAAPAEDAGALDADLPDADASLPPPPLKCELAACDAETEAACLGSCTAPCEVLPCVTGTCPEAGQCPVECTACGVMDASPPPTIKTGHPPD